MPRTIHNEGIATNIENAPLGDPLEQAIDIISELLELAKKNGFGREALSIVLREEIPAPPKRRPGAPKKRDEELYKRLAIALAKRTKGKSSVRGAQSKLARYLAEKELEQASAGRRVARDEIAKRTRTWENVISNIPPQYLLIATYLVRRSERDEPVEVSEQTIEGLLRGDLEAAREFLREVDDMKSLSRKFSDMCEK